MWKRKVKQHNKRYNNNRSNNNRNHYRTNTPKVTPLNHPRWRRDDKPNDYENENKTESESKSKQTSDSSWKPKKDLRLSRLEKIINFFQAKSHSKQEMEQAPIMLNDVLSKLNKEDINQLFHIKSEVIENEFTFIDKSKSDIPPNFSPLLKCLYSIRNTTNLRDIQYQSFLLNQWIEIIKMLLKHNANFFCCNSCKTELNIYEQYSECRRRGTRDYDYSHRRSVRYKLHNTPFKQLLMLFRNDINQSHNNRQYPHNKQAREREREQKTNSSKSFWWKETSMKSKIDNIHNCLYKLLQFILKENNVKLPIARIEFANGPRGTKLLFHTCLNLFPSYNMLYNLISIECVIPFKFIRKPSNKYQELSKEQVLKYCNGNDRFGCSGRLPVNWMVVLLYTYQQVYAQKAGAAVCDAVGDIFTDDIIRVILEYDTGDEYDFCFGGYRFLTDHEAVYGAINEMESYNIDKDERMLTAAGFTGYRGNVSVPSKHRTTTDVISSWLNAFQNPQFIHDHAFYRPGILNQKLMDKKLEYDLAELSKISMYYVDVGSAENKFNRLKEILISAVEVDEMDCTWMIVCEDEDGADTLQSDMRKIENERISSFNRPSSNEYMNYRCGSIASFDEHKSRYFLRFTNSILILYDWNVNIEQLVEQCVGYKFVMMLTNEMEDILKLKRNYDLDIPQLPQDYKNLMTQSDDYLY